MAAAAWAPFTAPGRSTSARVVALKILPPGIGCDPSFAERFAREVRALALLNHPGTVTLYEFGQVEYAATDEDPGTGATAGLLYFFLDPA